MPDLGHDSIVTRFPPIRPTIGIGTRRDTRSNPWSDGSHTLNRKCFTMRTGNVSRRTAVWAWIDTAHSSWSFGPKIVGQFCLLFWKWAFIFFAQEHPHTWRHGVTRYDIIDIMTTCLLTTYYCYTVLFGPLHTPSP